MKQALKHTDISIFSTFPVIFLQVCKSVLVKVVKYYLHAKFQVNWTTQTEITGEWGGGGGDFSLNQS